MSEEKQGWLSRLRAGLSKTSSKLSDGIVGLVTRRKLDDEMLARLEELLIEADMGAAVAAEMVAKLAEDRFDKEVSSEEVKAALAEYIEEALQPVAKPVDIDPSKKPFVILVVGVNGNGKTTTIGKMAKLLHSAGYKVMLGAADTFRAAAVEQLKIWGERNGVPVITGAHEADPASVAFAAVEQGRAHGADVVLIDTAGRLHTKQNLMAELQKIVKVLGKLDADAPHAVIQVLDATTGQNAITQVEAFRQMVKVTGLVVTKLDGTAKAGVVVALAKKFGLPIHAIGVGEGIDDLKDFDARHFAENLVGAR